MSIKINKHWSSTKIINYVSLFDELVLSSDIDIDDDNVRKYLNHLKFWYIKCFMTF
jgi:hypothetical protein